MMFIVLETDLVFLAFYVSNIITNVTFLVFMSEKCHDNRSTVRSIYSSFKSESALTKTITINHGLGTQYTDLRGLLTCCAATDI